jgi:hypothetical protein
MAPRRHEGSRSLFKLFFSVFFKMRRKWLPLEVEMWSFPLYPLSDVASSDDGRMELCIPRISWDLVGFHIRRRVLRFDYFNLRVSSFAMVDALVS